MRQFSKVYSSLWTSAKFSKLTDHFDRLVYLYIVTGPHANSSGCYDLKAGYAMADLECEKEAYLKAIDSLSKAGLIETDKGTNTVLIVNWMAFNEPTNAKHAVGVFTQLEAATSEKLKAKRGQELVAVVDAKKYYNDRACGEALHRLSEAYRYTRPDQTRPETTDPDQTQTQIRPRPETREIARAEHGPLSAEGRSGPAPPGRGRSPEGLNVHLLETSFMKGTG